MQDIIIVINAWNTSGLAYEGSGPVKRGRESEKTNGCYFLCEFSTGKVYHADLNASYNIGARYYIREILKSCSETERLALEVKVPEVARGSTCTLSALTECGNRCVSSAYTEFRLYGRNEFRCP